MDGYQSDEGSGLSYAHKSDVYTYRIPTPPRIVVPPPNLNAEALPEIVCHAIRGPKYEFLQHVDYENLIRQNAPLEWTYERRREAQPILPFLFLGPMTAAKDERWLQRNGITMLLGVRQRHPFASKMMSPIKHIADKQGIEYHAIDLGSNQDLIQNFPRTADLINEHLARSLREKGPEGIGRVLVFCESGNERGAGVVAAYLMATHEDVDFIKAMQLCQAQRFCVNFDDGVKRLLQGYWDILCAERAVAAGGPGPRTSDAPVKLRLKRELDMADDEDGMQTETDSAHAIDEGRPTRNAFVPFVDSSL